MPSFQLERTTGARDSQLIARSHFLKLISELAPQVVDDLWPTFWHLVFAISKRFGQSLISSPRENLAGREIFVRVHARACAEYRLLITNSEPSKWPWRALFATFEELHKLDRVSIERAFRGWRKLRKGKLRSGIDQWSIKWNLNADWCRDHALRVLVHFFFDGGLQNSFLHPHIPTLNPFLSSPKGQTLIHREGNHPIPGEPNNWPARIWASIAHEALQGEWDRPHSFDPAQPNVEVSRELLRWAIFGNDEPERLVLEDFGFSDDGWNFLDESAEEFKRRVEINFLIHIATLERAQLTAVKKGTASPGMGFPEDNHAALVDWRPRQLRIFRKKLLAYVTSVNGQKLEMTKDIDLCRFPTKLKFDKHIRLSINYQIPNASLELNSLTSLGKPSAVTQAIDEILALIDLPRRNPNPTGGRKRGSKNKFSLRSLGR